MLRGNKVLVYGVAAIFTAQAFHLRTAIPGRFSTDGVPLHWWPWMILGGMAFFLVVETREARCPRGGPGEGGPVRSVSVRPA